MAGNTLVRPGGIWQVARGGAGRVGAAGDPCCCGCITYQQAVAHANINAQFSNVQFDFTCYPPSPPAIFVARQLASAQLNQFWNLPRFSDDGNTITLRWVGVPQFGVGKWRVFSGATCSGPSNDADLLIIAKLIRTGGWSVYAGSDPSFAAGMAFKAAGSGCLPTTVANQLFVFGPAGTDIVVGAAGKVDFSF
jgi:hypothetical protein